MHVTPPEAVLDGGVTVNEREVTYHPFTPLGVAGDSTIDGAAGPIASNLNEAEVAVLVKPAGSVQVVLAD